MGREYLEELKKIIETSGSLPLLFGKYSRIYSMTTENISGFLKRYDLNGKKVLTVAGSGDQRLNAYLYGASEVKTFDINPLVQCHLQLKDEAIRSINFEKFVSFFGINNKRYSDYYTSFDERIYEEIRDNLPEKTRYIFDYLISNYISLYYNFENRLSKLEKMNGYLNKDDYERIREILKTKKELDFLCCNVSDLKNKIKDEKFDMILLSNISDYINDFFGYYGLKRYRDLIYSLMDNLNYGGILQVGYVYSRYGKYIFKSDFINNDDRNKYFSPDVFEIAMVGAYDNPNPYAYDKVITYTKK